MYLRLTDAIVLASFGLVTITNNNDHVVKQVTLTAPYDKNIGIKVWAVDDDVFGSSSNNVLVVYKGVSTSTDCGLIYAPYVTAVTTGISMDPITFQPMVGMLTRGGYHAVPTVGNYIRTTTLVMPELPTVDTIQ